MNLRRDLAEEVQTRLNAGKRKDTIYNELKETFGSSSVERSLAQWSYPQDKQKTAT